MGRKARGIMRKLAAVLLIGCLLLAACQPAIETLATPANALFTTNGNAVTPGNYITPGNYVTMTDALDPTEVGLVTPSNYATPSDAEMIPPGVDATQYTVLTQERMDKAMEAFFAGREARYFTYDVSDAGGPNVWIEKPLIQTETDSKGQYETMDAKAYSDGVVYDMWSYRRTPDVGFTFGIYGRNLMSEEQVEALRPSDGVAWMSLMQGAISGEESAALEAAAEKAMPRKDAIEKAAAFLTALGIEAPAPTAVLATYRWRTGDQPEGAEPDTDTREYGWLVTFNPLHYETIQVGVTPSGYGQLSWSVEF